MCLSSVDGPWSCCHLLAVVTRAVHVHVWLTLGVFWFVWLPAFPRVLLTGRPISKIACPAQEEPLLSRGWGWQLVFWFLRVLSFLLTLTILLPNIHSLCKVKILFLVSEELCVQVTGTRSCPQWLMV